MSATIVEVVNTLGNFNLEMTPGQITKALDLLHQRRSMMAADVVRTFSVGDDVEFEARGRKHVGKITKINIKTVSVVTPTNRWKVSGSLLSLHKAN